jgi:hypothetical protein
MLKQKQISEKKYTQLVTFINKDERVNLMYNNLLNSKRRFNSLSILSQNLSSIDPAQLKCLINTYGELAQIKLNPGLSPLLEQNPSNEINNIRVPSAPSEILETKENVREDAGGQS